MLLARKCKISIADFGLIPLKSGELAYITRRMDRTENGALHMEDFCQILNKMTDLKYNGSMEQIGKAIHHFFALTPDGFPLGFLFTPKSDLKTAQMHKGVTFRYLLFRQNPLSCSTFSPPWCVILNFRHSA